MSLLRKSAFTILMIAHPAFAQEVQWNLVDTGVLNHSSHGEGIEMRIKPEPMPDGLFESDELDDLMLALCKHYAPSVIPFVKEKTDLENPSFVSVRLVSGGAVFGRYVLQAFQIADDTCGNKL